MGFRFRFETLSRVRKIREDLALQEFSKAQKKLQDLEGMKADKLSQDAQGPRPHAEDGSGHPCPGRQVLHPLHRLFGRRGGADRQAHRAGQKTPWTRSAKNCFKAKQEHKAMDRLREIDLERYIQEQSRQEMQFIDEIAIMRHGRRV